MVKIEQIGITEKIRYSLTDLENKSTWENRKRSNKCRM